MKTISLLFLLTLTACTTEAKDSAEPAENTNADTDNIICPSPDEDECMTDAMFSECQTEENTCDGTIALGGGCPYTAIECQ